MTLSEKDAVAVEGSKTVWSSCAFLHGDSASLDLENWKTLVTTLQGWIQHSHDPTRIDINNSGCYNPTLTILTTTLRCHRHFME